MTVYHHVQNRDEPLQFVGKQVLVRWQARYNRPVQIDREQLRRHYASLSDDSLLAIDPDELTEIAQGLYVEELAERGITLDEEPGRSPATCPGLWRRR